MNSDIYASIPSRIRATDSPPGTPGQAGLPGLVETPGIIALDADWQFPAITERHAFAQLAAQQPAIPGGALYVGYPWATLIDKLKKQTPDREAELARFAAFCARLPAGRPRVTVCQHIFAHRFTWLFRRAGIDDVFWSHATHDDVTRPPEPVPDAPRFHPFPLYPVQIPTALPDAAPEADASPRRYLFSFVGARSNPFYLTQARRWILDHLSADPRGLITGRDGWHYQKIVYQLQVEKTAASASDAGLVDQAASDAFVETLRQSRFSLCPSGTGPNSIRLWESIGAGAVPVILADSWAPPGDPRLWEMAAVFCPETPEAVHALPDRLALLAAESGRLAGMRHAMRQLWLLYGPPGFVTDLQAFLLAGGGPRRATETTDRAPEPAAEPAADRLLLDWSGRLLIDPAAALARLAAEPALGHALATALAQSREEAICAHYRAVLRHAQARTGQSLPVPVDGAPPLLAPALAPALAARRPPRICLFGRHSHRTPLAYPAFRRLLGERVALVDNPAAADLLVTGFDQDFRESLGQLLALKAGRGGPQLAVLSEEPLWDVTWSTTVVGRRGHVAHSSANGTEQLEYAHLGHGSSAIYDFERLPYYLVAEAQFIPRYANLIACQARRSPAALLAHWRRAPIRAAFFAEKRTGARYCETAWDGDILRLSAYRSALAERMQAQGALCMGKGWGAEGAQAGARRQDLPDWHLDKLAHLHDRCALMGAQENIHHRLYVSEKIFDAFACGAVPTYVAAPGHRVFELVSAAAMLNTHGQDVEAAAARLAGFTPDMALAEAWLETCRGLAALFGDFAAIERERIRIADAVVSALRGLL